MQESQRGGDLPVEVGVRSLTGWEMIDAESMMIGPESAMGIDKGIGMTMMIGGIADQDKRTL